MKKRLWSILTALALCLSLLPTVALAADPVTNVPYLDENGTLQTCGIATEVTSSDTTWGTAGTTTWYVVQGNVAFGTAGTNQRVYTYGDVHLILADGCTLTLEDGLTTSGDLTIYAQSTGDEQGKMCANDQESDESSWGVNICGDLTINGGSIEASSSAAEDSYGILAYNMTVNGGSVKATGGAADMSYGICVAGPTSVVDSGSMTINGGSVTATGGEGSCDSHGIYAKKELTITGGTVKAEGGDATESYGICADNELTITGNADVTATGGEAEGSSYGIYGAGTGLTISGGTVTAEGGEAMDSYGIYAANDLTITGNTVIFASSIDGTEGESNPWSGVIFEGNEGKVYGNPTLTADLTIPEGATLTNNGSIYVDGTLTKNGTVSGTGGVYYPLTVTGGTATDTSTYNNKTYGEAGSTITLTPDIPLTGLQFKQWNVSLADVTIANNSFTMPSAALTVTAQFTSVPGSFVEVSTEDQLRLALDSGATSIKLTGSFNINTANPITVRDKEITLDLNGYVLTASDGKNYHGIITLDDGNSTARTSLTLIDSNPNKSNVVDKKQYKGGVINGGVTVTASGKGNNDCRLYANGGSVAGTVGLSSLSASIYCTSDTPTAFYANVGQYGSIYGGIFYGNTSITKIKGKTVTFQYNGSTYAREVVESGNAAVAPIPPQETTADGYHINWYQGDAEVSYDFSTPVTEDITLTAAWENTYRITFDTAGGTAVAPIMQAYNAEVTELEAPTRTGYTFKGWNPATVPMKDITVTAQWTANEYDISYEGMEGAEYAGTLPTTHTYDTETAIPTPIKTGYTFAGWQVNDGETLVKELTLGATDYTDPITLTAVWTPNVYNVMLDTNGGTILKGDVTEYTYGVGATLPTKVTRSGYYFIGWYDNEAFRGKPVSEITTTDIGDKTFYAGWIAISATPTYPPTTEETEGGTVTVLPKSPAQGVTVTITPTPDEGYAVAQVIVTDKNGDPVEVTDNGDGTYSFKQPSGKVTISVTFAEIEQPGGNPFVDVPADAYYYDAVLWAVENGVTEGTNADGTLFSPNDPCTRAQVVTFLWRAAGSPEPESLRSFADVSADSYYAKAVAWAVENGITTGTGDGLFSPDAVCSRAQIVTFLWRAQQSPAAGSANPFLDVAADAYYTDAVLWAVENGVTMGTNAEGTAFSPDDDCTRAQIVTFLYRCLGGE